jgi:hypothetical protein
MLVSDVKISAQPLPLVEVEPAPEPLNLRWTAQYLKPEYRPLASWLELDFLIMRIGQENFDYLIVESPHTGRFAQALGDPEGMIIEVCGEMGINHPEVWQLRRASSNRLPDAELTAQLFEGDGVDPDALFTASEASELFRGWLQRGSVGKYQLVPVIY